MAVFLSFGLLAINIWFSGSGLSREGILGGPWGTNLEFGKSDDLPTSFNAPSVVHIENYASPADFSGDKGNHNGGSLAATLEGQSQPVGIFSSRGGPVSYKVKKGDTLSGIAAQFGISTQTITAANPEIRVNSLRVGQELRILPVSGILYEVRGGETLESISEFFNIPPQQIQEQNPSVNFGKLDAGAVLVIPGVKSGGSLIRKSGLPDLRGYYVYPTQGFNWGRLHYDNAVDIANACGTPVEAAAEGLVVDVAEGGWNDGYGNFVLVEHPNETKTRYAHLDDISAKIGDYIKQSQPIGTMGNTGNVHGPTGCHLHFEVEGAQNPFVKH